MRVVLVIALGLAVIGCRPSITSSSPNHVTVESYQMNEVQAQQIADAECAKYHRRARIALKPTTREDEREYIFSCIE
jgi:hypothetical protein